MLVNYYKPIKPIVLKNEAENGYETQLVQFEVNNKLVIKEYLQFYYNEMLKDITPEARKVFETILCFEDYQSTIEALINEGSADDFVEYLYNEYGG